MCQETAALLVCGDSDASLFPQVAQQLRTSSHTLKALHRELYLPEQHLVALNIFSSRARGSGQLAWMHGYNVGQTVLGIPGSRLPGISGLHACQFFPQTNSETAVLQRQGICPQYEAAQIFFSSWLAAAWQVLLGSYREKSIIEESLLEAISESQMKRQTWQIYQFQSPNREMTYCNPYLGRNRQSSQVSFA